MGKTLDDTEQLLVQLEAELAQQQATVDARLAREKAAVDGLQAQLEQLTSSTKGADAEFERLAPLRDAAVNERDALARAGSRGNRWLASFWSTATVGLAIGAVLPLFGLNVDKHHAFLVPTLVAAVVAILSGGTIAGWARRRR